MFIVTRSYKIDVNDNLTLQIFSDTVQTSEPYINYLPYFMDKFRVYALLVNLYDFNRCIMKM